MYLEILQKYASEKPYGQIGQAATERQMLQAEQKLGVKFPNALRELYREVDGDGYFLFSLERMVETAELLHEALSSGYPNTTDYLFFAENGCGDYYGYTVQNGCPKADEIVLWCHEDNAVVKVAEDIAQLISRYYQGEI